MTNIDCQQYQVVFDRPWETLHNLLSEGAYSQVFILVDENTNEHCLPIIKENTLGALSVITIPAGEIHKQIQTCQTIWSQLIKHGADRHSCLLNLGGGVIGDMGGFCASTFMRGIDFVQIPTTLLSQVDASVGSKLGIDYEGFKNLVGVFNEPQAVIVYPPFLTTLDKRELRSGCAEIIKHALIKDKALWDQLIALSSADEIATEAIIHRNVEIKKEVVDDDPYERGVRKILNFGHTIGHAIETEYLQSSDPLLHGEAIAIGMICESWMASELGMLTKDKNSTIKSYLRMIYPDLPKKITNHEGIITSMLKDKKNKGGTILASLLEDIGRCAFNIPLNAELIVGSLLAYDS